jgi:GT2 family glycosyltransferase
VSRIAVVIVNFNSGPLLKRCLRALELQERRADAVIVVDNDSHDESLKDAESFDWIQLISADRNLGFAAASNLGVQHAEDCEWVALLNPDAFADPHWLSALDIEIQKSKAYSSFASRMMIHDQPGIMDGAGDAYHLSGRPWRISHGKPMTDGDQQPKEVFGACAGAAIYNRQVFLDVGCFDEDYFCYLEDVDLAFRLQLTNHKCLYVPDAVVSHVGSAITGRDSDFQVYHAHRNIVWTYFKNMPLSLLIITLPLHLLMNIYTIILFGLRGRGKVIAKAKLDALSGVFSVMDKRRKNMLLRKASSIKILGVLAFFLS